MTERDRETEKERSDGGRAHLKDECLKGWHREPAIPPEFLSKWCLTPYQHFACLTLHFAHINEVACTLQIGVAVAAFAIVMKSHFDLGLWEFKAGHNGAEKVS